MSDNNLPPRVIAFEGCAGSHKSTQLKRAEDFLSLHGVETVVVSNPGTTPMANMIREHFLSHDLSERIRLQAMLLSLVSSAVEVIYPALRSGKWVLLNRWTLSTLIYQGLIPGRSIYSVMDALKQALPTEFYPECYFVYSVTPENAKKRIKDSREDLSVFEKDDKLLERVATAYGFAHSILPGSLVDIFTIDANREDDKVWETTVKYLEAILENARNQSNG